MLGVDFIYVRVRKTKEILHIVISCRSSPDDMYKTKLTSHASRFSFFTFHFSLFIFHFSFIYGCNS